MRRLFIISFFTMSVCTLDCWSSEIDSISSSSRLLFEPKFHSLQIDAASILFIDDVAIEVDYDFLNQISKQNPSHSLNVGLRFGIDKIWSASFGGITPGSPFLETNLYVRSTDEWNHFRFDMLVGLTYHVKSDPSEDRAKIFLLKGCLEIKWMFVKNVVGLFLKIAGDKETGLMGIGLFLGSGNS